MLNPLVRIVITILGEDKAQWLFYVKLALTKFFHVKHFGTYSNHNTWRG